MTNQSPDLPNTLSALRRSRFSEECIANRTVKVELRDNLLRKMDRGETLFPGVVGFEETVIPQVVNAILSRHNFILLGLRGQAKTKLIRMLTTLLDPYLPVIAGSEIHDNPYCPISKYSRQLIEEMGDETPIAYRTPDQRYVEKLATPDVTIADMIGDIDPIKAARRGANISDELTVHYGLLPRSNRGIFAVNELPDLAGKIQVGLFNILQEGDVQIKGYPVRLPLDLMMVFTANPEDYTARGKIITPLKDRIGSEIRTHYPLTVEHGLTITAQEAWTKRRSPIEIQVPEWILETVEQLAFVAREDKRVDKRSGVSQRLPISVIENVVSNAERRAIVSKEPLAVPRVLDIYAALPSITGKLELEYEGELKGGDAVARELIRSAVARVYNNLLGELNTREIQQYFNQGGVLKLEETMPSARMVRELSVIDGLLDKVSKLSVPADAPDALRAAAAEFILEGLHALRRIGRTEELGFTGGERQREEPTGEDPFNRRRVDKRRSFN
jgi:magnesium chelatase subunit I